MDAHLLVSVSGLDTGTMSLADDVLADLDRRAVPVSLLVKPRACTPPLTAWVKARASRGDSVLLHGYDHFVSPSRTTRIGRRAEFAALPAHEANLRLTAARITLEAVDLLVDGFAPPRWLASQGTLAALRGHGFTLCADLAGVHDLRTGEHHRARVYTLSGISARTETVRCFAFVLAAARAARRGGLVRLGVDIADLRRPGPRQALTDAVDVAVEAGAAPSTYAGSVTSSAPMSSTRTSVPSGARLVNSP